MARKVVQIAVVDHSNNLIALCDDGTLWLGNVSNEPGVAWQQMTPPPDTLPGPAGSFRPTY